MTNYDYIHYLLRHYHKLKKDLEYLKQELIIAEEYDSTITGMTLSSQVYGMKTQKNRISDPTANAALVFRKENERINRCFSDRNKTELMVKKLEDALSFIDISLQKLKEIKFEWYNVLYWLMIKRVSWVAFSIDNNVSTTQTHKYMVKAIKQLTKWWEGDFTWEIKESKQEVRHSDKQVQ